MGGYGAIKIALKYYSLFSIGISHSGSLEKSRTPDVHSVFGDPEQNAQMRYEEHPLVLAERALS